MPSTTITLTNDRATSDDVRLLLVAKSVTGLTGITLDTVTKLGELTTAGQIGFETITSGRLYVGLGDFANPPTPDGTDYYGFIEFSKTSDTAEVWINLSNVDLVGLPLSLAGTDTAGAPFSLGYQTPVASATPNLIDQIKAILLDSKPVITTATGQVKIAAPTIFPDSYPSFDEYVASLATAGASLEIISDIPAGGSAKTFKGRFMAATAPTDVLISMVSQDADKDTYDILLGQFTSEILYRCDGGTIEYNGETLPQNRTAKNDPGSTEAERTITNSVFRDIVTGMNEGYFSPGGPNESRLFSGMVPFADGGSQFAQIIHQGSNSYGFPYADGNLKTLITADPSDVLSLTILKDDQAFGYQVYTSTPDDGIYQFGIGAGSSGLGTIKIDIWSYDANPEGAYGGFLPYLTEWTKMEFPDLGPDHYIWIKNGDVDAGTCLGAAPVWVQNHTVLEWGANVSWQDGATPPAKPPALAREAEPAE